MKVDIWEIEYETESNNESRLLVVPARVVPTFRDSREKIKYTKARRVVKMELRNEMVETEGIQCRPD